MECRIGRACTRGGSREHHHAESAIPCCARDESIGTSRSESVKDNRAGDRIGNDAGSGVAIGINISTDNNASRRARGHSTGQRAAIRSPVP